MLGSCPRQILPQLLREQPLRRLVIGGCFFVFLQLLPGLGALEVHHTVIRILAHKLIK
jgi:hypothetical protein